MIAWNDLDLPCLREGIQEHEPVALVCPGRARTPPAEQVPPGTGHLREAPARGPQIRQDNRYRRQDRGPGQGGIDVHIHTAQEKSPADKFSIGPGREWISGIQDPTDFEEPCAPYGGFGRSRRRGKTTRDLAREIV